ncbi:MAG: TrkH family potassium uptake protein [Candidatus Omnitrophota bacterium]|nr:TrkH family potassium uptake protein [Candidatus Omnitrophota bacterium]
MNFAAIFYLLGKLLMIMGALVLLPAGVAWYYGELVPLQHFVMTAAVAGFLGLFAMILCRGSRDESLRVRDGFLLVTLAWVLVSLIGAIPFFQSEHFPLFIDALFEATSGFTTTGASVLSDVEVLSRSLLFWRSFTHWIGGMGIIVLVIAILPQLSVGGMQLIKNEMPGPTFEQLKPRIQQTALSLWRIYLLFSIAEIICLWVAGMSFFDSVCHMFGTMGTGGFSTRNASIGAYSTTIQMIITFFMFLAGTNFVLHYTNLTGNLKKMFLDAEWRFYVSLLVVFAAVICVDLTVQGNLPVLESLRFSIFQVTSITTTTGYATTDFDTWPYLSKGVLFLLMFVGGCAGSTSGGLKQMRLLLLFKRAKQSIVQHIFPKAVVTVKVNQRAVPESVLYGVSSFFLIYIVIFSFCTLPLLAFNIDFITATSAVVACLSNIGPGFGLVGATQNYAFFPWLIKLLLCACMIIGRLEIFTVLVLFFPATWRK